MNTTTLLLFSVVALVAIATPGPTVLLALANGSRYGLRPSMAGMFGAVLSDFVLVGAVALGLGALLAASEFWFTVLKYLGAVYLAWLGWRLLRSQGGFEVPREGQPLPGANGRSIFMKSFLVAVNNPKGYLFCSALLPQFIDPAAAKCRNTSPSAPPCWAWRARSRCTARARPEPSCGRRKTDSHHFVAALGFPRAAGLCW